MLRSQSDVKFDTGDKEESGCLSANPRSGTSLGPSAVGRRAEQPVAGSQVPCTQLRRKAVDWKSRVLPMGQRG